ncbi:cobalamin B12-binding domain-containing protein [bacterium]|nr:cobalamin B12-binding domain-containing protein [bacterium]
MKILLVNPPFNILREKYDSSVSVGLLCLGTYLHSKGVQVTIIDGARESDFLNKILSTVSDFRFVGLSVMTTQIPQAMKVSKRIREVHGKSTIIWGGAHPTFFAEQTVSDPVVDIVCFGEGEETLLEIVQGKPLEEILGIAFKKDLNVIKNQPRARIDPTKTPSLNWNLISPEVLSNLSLVPSLTSRGCPHRCTFCVNAIQNYHWKSRESDQVISDLIKIKDFPVFSRKKIRFWDENFFVDIKRSREIVEGMIRNKLNLSWETTVRADYFRKGFIDNQFLGRLKASGCYLLAFGAESGSPDILKKINKDLTPSDIIASAKLCLINGIIPQYSFMIGLPGEKKQDMLLTIDLIRRLRKLSPKVQFLGPQAFRPYPGSLLYQECLRAGWQAPKDLKDWESLARNQLSYLSVQQFPWVNEKDFVEAMEVFVRFGAHPIKEALKSTTKASFLLKLGLALVCKLRWKFRFFEFPIEFLLAKKFVSRLNSST